MKLTPIMVCGVMVLVTTVLVKRYAWDPFLAVLAAGGGGLALAVTILLGVLPFLNATQRREMLGIAWKTMREDFRQIIDVLIFRR